MSVDPFEPVEVGPDAPLLGPGEEWVHPHGRPDTDRLVVRTVPDDAPPLVREGLVRRRIQAVEGTCPCDGRLLWWDECSDPEARERIFGPTTDYGGGVDSSRVVAVHRDECPAHDRNLVPALAAWHEERGD
ncbi:hypothetical protein D514_0115770 [Microbacterium sp. UCD-TDU]|nr:hypothetical protein D514_0115770 [Microbacterium sp. UCD-TDU]